MGRGKELFEGGNSLSALRMDERLPVFVFSSYTTRRKMSINLRLRAREKRAT